MNSKIPLYGAVGRVHSGSRESNQEDENKKGLGSVFFSFDLSFFGSKAKQDRGVFKDFEPSIRISKALEPACGNEIQLDL